MLNDFDFDYEGSTTAEPLPQPTTEQLKTDTDTFIQQMSQLAARNGVPKYFGEFTKKMESFVNWNLQVSICS